MSYIDELLHLYSPWLAFAGVIFTFVRLFLWARNKKTGAFVFGMLMQMIMPDPYVEQTINVVQEQKQATKKAQDECGEPKNDEKHLDCKKRKLD